MGGAIESTALYDKTLGCLLGGLIGDAIGTPTEGKHYRDIEAQHGWVSDFDCDGTDDTVMKTLLAEALIRTEGYATLDDWAQVWLDHWEAIFGPKLSKFFVSVVHTAQKVKRHSVPRMAALGNMPSSSSAMCISPVGIVNACNPAQAAQQAYNLASLIHVHDVGYCQDGAAAMAAAVAEAMRADATVPSVLDAALEAIIPLSGCAAACAPGGWLPRLPPRGLCAGRDLLPRDCVRLAGDGSACAGPPVLGRGRCGAERDLRRQPGP